MADQAQPTPPASWAQLAAEPAGPTSLTALTNLDPGALVGADLVDAVVCTEKAISLLSGLQARLLAALAVPFAAGDPTRLAAKLARRSGLAGGDDIDTNVLAMIPEAATCLAASEIAAALRIAPVTAGIRVRESVHLTEELSPARESLEAGLIDRGKLRAIVEQVQVLPAQTIGPVLDQVLPAAADRSTSEIRDIAAQAVIAADPDGAADRHRQAAARRNVTIAPGADAMATLKAFLPADGAVKIFQVSDLLATGTAGQPNDPRGIGERRADALVDLADRLLTDGLIDLTGYLGHPLPDHSDRRPHRSRPDHANADPRPADPPTANNTGHPDPANGATPAVDPPPNNRRRASRVMSRQGRRPHLTVTIGLDTLAGLNNLPALLAGYGTITADLARTIASSAGTITAALTDPATGAVITAGELTYRPRQGLRDLVGTITDTCQFPSCRQPAWRCDVDHRDPFDHQHPDRGGPTNPSNTGSLCRRHHLLKDHADWNLSIDTNRLIINWTSPTGHRYTRNARQAVPPDAWIRTAGTTVAEHVDQLVSAADTTHTFRPGTTPDDPHPGGRPTSLLEDLLTDALLWHHLAHPTRIQLDPTGSGQANGPHPHRADDQDLADDTTDIDDDPPPF